jgi:hypothetical protein
MVVLDKLDSPVIRHTYHRSPRMDRTPIATFTPWRHRKPQPHTNMAKPKSTKTHTTPTSYMPPPAPASQKRSTPSDTEETKSNLSGLTATTTPSPPKKQRRTPKLTEHQAATTAAVYSAMLACLDLIDPLMEFTRACAKLPAGSPKQKRVDEEEQRVRDVFERLRERFENAPVGEETKVVFNEFDEAEVVDSSEEGTGGEEDTEEEVVQLVKPKKKEKVNVYSGAGGEVAGKKVVDEVEVEEQVEEHVETDVEKEVKKEVDQRGNEATAKIAKKHKKR